MYDNDRQQRQYLDEVAMRAPPPSPTTTTPDAAMDNITSSATLPHRKSATRDDGNGDDKIMDFYRSCDRKLFLLKDPQQNCDPPHMDIAEEDDDDRKPAARPRNDAEAADTSAAGVRAFHTYGRSSSPIIVIEDEDDDRKPAAKPLGSTFINGSMHHHYSQDTQDSDKSSDRDLFTPPLTDSPDSSGSGSNSPVAIVAAAALASIGMASAARDDVRATASQTDVATTSAVTPQAAGILSDEEYARMLQQQEWGDDHRNRKNNTDDDDDDDDDEEIRRMIGDIEPTPISFNHRNDQLKKSTPPLQPLPQPSSSLHEMPINAGRPTKKSVSFRPLLSSTIQQLKPPPQQQTMKDPPLPPAPLDCPATYNDSQNMAVIPVTGETISVATSSTSAAAVSAAIGAAAESTMDSKRNGGAWSTTILDLSVSELTRFLQQDYDESVEEEDAGPSNKDGVDKDEEVQFLGSAKPNALTCDDDDDDYDEIQCLGSSMPPPSRLSKRTREEQEIDDEYHARILQKQFDEEDAADAKRIRLQAEQAMEKTIPGKATLFVSEILALADEWKKKVMDTLREEEEEAEDDPGNIGNDITSKNIITRSAPGSGVGGSQIITARTVPAGQRRSNTYIFLQALFAILRRTNPGMLAQVKKLAQDCYDPQKKQEAGYTGSRESYLMKCVKEVVNERDWKTAERFYNKRLDKLQGLDVMQKRIVRKSSKTSMPSCSDSDLTQADAKLRNRDAIEAVAKDDMVFLTEAMLTLQDKFRHDGKPTPVDLGIHYTSSSNLERIRTDGLLTKADRDSRNILNRHNGSTYGDGVYTADDLYSSSKYGDTGLIVARLKGNIGSDPKDTSGDTFCAHEIGRPFVVLRKSSQCLALLQFDVVVVQSMKSIKCRTMFAHLQNAIQKIIDKYFNNGQATQVVHFSERAARGSHSRALLVGRNCTRSWRQAARAIFTAGPGIPSLPPLNKYTLIRRKYRQLPAVAPTTTPKDMAVAAATDVASRLTSSHGYFLRRLGGRDLNQTGDVSTSALKQELPEVITYTAPESLDDGREGQLFGLEETQSDLGECSICLDEMCAGTSIARMLLCRHKFHSSCIKQHFSCCSKTCPCCRKVVGRTRGKMPSGSMIITCDQSKCCAGHEPGIITIKYFIRGGIQKNYHENPGSSHSPTQRMAYLPNNDQGQKLLKRLKFAFKRGLTFTVGTSSTTNRRNCVIWSSIHHKTSLSGGAHGFPDPNFFTNSNEELDNAGVPSSDDL